MSKKLERRLAKSEIVLACSEHSLHEIYVSGGLQAGVAIRASFAGYRLEGEPGETFDDFCVRARAAAHAVKAKLIVFGGLPATPTEWAQPPGLEEALAKAAMRGSDEIDSDEQGGA